MHYILSTFLVEINGEHEASEFWWRNFLVEISIRIKTLNTAIFSVRDVQHGSFMVQSQTMGYVEGTGNSSYKMT